MMKHRKLDLSSVRPKVNTGNVVELKKTGTIRRKQEEKKMSEENSRDTRKAIKIVTSMFNRL
jgi:hypothetical protein